MNSKRNNIVLIGMPGAGKSAVGRELAKKLAMSFLDIDEYIEQQENKKLQEIIDECGDDGFVEIEKNHILGLDLSNYIISTGGSVVLREETMEHLKSLGLVVYLNAPLEILEKRLDNLKTRGVVGLASGLSLKNIFDLRAPLYRRYADLTVNIPSQLTTEEVVDLLEKEIAQI